MNDMSGEEAAQEEGSGRKMDMDPMPALDATDVTPHVGFADVEQFESKVLLERHQRHDPKNRGHIDLTQEEYTPHEVARLASTSLEVVMHAIQRGDLKAQRQGRAVVCIEHAAVTDWLRRRAAE